MYKGCNLACNNHCGCTPGTTLGGNKKTKNLTSPSPTNFQICWWNTLRAPQHCSGAAELLDFLRERKEKGAWHSFPGSPAWEETCQLLGELLLLYGSWNRFSVISPKDKGWTTNMETPVLLFLWLLFLKLPSSLLKENNPIRILNVPSKHFAPGTEYATAADSSWIRNHTPDPCPHWSHSNRYKSQVTDYVLPHKQLSGVIFVKSQHIQG